MSTVRACPGCGAEVRALRPTCRACGALLIAAPAPAVASPGTAGSAGAPTAEEQFFAPAVLQPIVQLPPSSTASGARSARGSGIRVGGDAGKWIVLGAMLLFFAAAVATAYFTLKPAANKRAQTPEVLAPRAPTEGLPSGLDTVVRMQAESARRTALQTAEELGGGDLARLAASQPGFQWVAGDRPSTDAHTVSVAQGAGVVTMAVAASNHDVCAFGQWAIGGTARYVTMGHQPVCAAINAPAEGWSSEPGGAASDLPDDTG
jgi:hypothetical protein